MIRQKTSDLKRRFAERTAERRAARDEAKLGKLSIRNSTSEDSSSTVSTKSSIMNFAIASSTIASSCGSSSNGTENRDASKHYHSDLYQRSSMQTKVVHPIVHKRDIFLASRTAPARTSRTRETTQKGTVKKRSGGVMNDIADSRGGIMNDISNGSTEEPEAKTTLPPYSLTGSMLCREMEQGNIRPNGTTANQQMFSPQKPMGLPSNTIMASMLFRTLQQEEESESTSHVSLNQYGVPTKSKKRVPKEVLPSPTSRSEVSELTLQSKESEVDPNMVKASKNLLRILQNNQFQAFDNNTKPKCSILYEA